MIPILTPKTVAVASLLVAGTVVPQPDTPSSAEPAHVASAAEVQPATSSHARTYVIPDPVPVPSSRPSQPIVIDLK